MSNEKRKAGTETPPWMVTYADMMALLLCLFVLLLSFSEVDSDSFKQNAGPINQCLRHHQDQPRYAEPLGDPDSDHDHRSVQEIPPRTEADVRASADPEPGDHEPGHQPRRDQGFRNHPLPGHGRLRARQRDPAGGASSRPSSGSPTSCPRPPARSRFRGIPTARPSRAVSSAPTGTCRPPARLPWSTRSSRTARVNSGRITAQGFAETRPLYPNDTPENRAENRRVEIAIEIPVRDK